MLEKVPVPRAASRPAAALVALLAWLGLAIQFDATAREVGSAAAAAFVVSAYFTISTNLLVSVVLTGLAAGVPALSGPRLIAGTTLSILLVGVIYGLLLHGTTELSGGSAVANVMLHMVTPVLVPLFWLGFVRKGALGWSDPMLWALYPLAYLAYGLLRGAGTGRYAYPFIDAARLGWGQVGVNAFLIALGYMVAGFALVALDRRLAGGAPAP